MTCLTPLVYEFGSQTVRVLLCSRVLLSCEFLLWCPFIVSHTAFPVSPIYPLTHSIKMFWRTPSRLHGQSESYGRSQCDPIVLSDLEMVHTSRCCGQQGRCPDISLIWSSNAEDLKSYLGSPLAVYILVPYYCNSKKTLNIQKITITNNNDILKEGLWTDFLLFPFTVYFILHLLLFISWKK